MEKIIFLDRDGTLNKEKDYLFKIEDFEFIDGTLEALKIFSELGYKLIVVTNQSGIARGYYKENDVENLHKYLYDYLKTLGIKIDKFYYCPHHPEKGIGKYRIDCDCRKPKTGMFKKAFEEFEVDKENSFMVGDNISDIEAGLNSNLKAILVKTGHGYEHEEKALKMKNVEVYDSLIEFANHLKNEIRSKKY